MGKALEARSTPTQSQLNIASQRQTLPPVELAERGILDRVRYKFRNSNSKEKLNAEGRTPAQEIAAKYRERNSSPEAPKKIKTSKREKLRRLLCLGDRKSLDRRDFVLDLALREFARRDSDVASSGLSSRGALDALADSTQYGRDSDGVGKRSYDDMD